MIDNIDVDLIVSELTILKLKNKGSYYIGLCPFHNDRKPSFAIYRNSGRFICFSCNKRGSLKYLYETLTGNKLNDENKNNVFINTINKKIKRKTLLENKSKLVIDGTYDNLRSNFEAYCYALKRGMSESFIDQFKVMYSDNFKVNTTDLSNRIILPLYENKKLTSFEARSFNNRYPKVLYPKQGKINGLFNIDNLDKNEPLIIVEGIFDLFLIWEFISKNVTCTFGCALTQKQIELLKDFKEIVLFIDDDDAGHREISYLDERLDKEFYVTWIEGKDPGAGNLKEIQYALDNKITIIEYLKLKYGIKKRNLRGWIF